MRYFLANTELASEHGFYLTVLFCIEQGNKNYMDQTAQGLPLRVSLQWAGAIKPKIYKNNLTKIFNMVVRNLLRCQHNIIM